MDQYVDDLLQRNDKARKEDLRVHEFYRKKKVAGEFYHKLNPDEESDGGEGLEPDFNISPESEYGKNLYGK